MREPAVMFRVPAHILSNLDALARRLNISVNIVAKLIVTREIMQIPAMLEEHDRQLANIHLFLRELAFRNEEFVSGESVHAARVRVIVQRLDDVMVALDAIRDAAYVRPSTYIADLIRNQDERHVHRPLRG
jgi:hypothetical protein